MKLVPLAHVYHNATHRLAEIEYRQRFRAPAAPDTAEADQLLAEACPPFEYETDESASEGNVVDDLVRILLGPDVQYRQNTNPLTQRLWASPVGFAR